MIAAELKKLTRHISLTGWGHEDFKNGNSVDYFNLLKRELSTDIVSAEAVYSTEAYAAPVSAGNSWGGAGGAGNGGTGIPDGLVPNATGNVAKTETEEDSAITLAPQATIVLAFFAAAQFLLQ